MYATKLKCTSLAPVCNYGRIQRTNASLFDAGPELKTQDNYQIFRDSTPIARHSKPSDTCHTETVSLKLVLK